MDAGRAHVAEAQSGSGVPSVALPLADDDDEELGPIPWHLKLLAGALAVYLGYRALQGIEWVFGR